MQHKRVAYVDGLRAVAVLSVVLHHAAKYDLAMPLGPLRHVLLEGAHGVDLFFVISGFCLAYPTIARLRAGGAAGFDVARYWARRLVRILPPFWAALGVFAAGAIALATTGWPVPGPGWVAPESWISVARQALLLDPTTVWANGSFWSLAIEFRWYLAFPFLLALWVRAPRLFWMCAAASFVAFHFTRLAVWDFATLPAFMLGIVAADLHARDERAWRWAVPGFAGAIALALLTEPRASEGFYQQTQAGWQIAAFCFVAAAGTLSPLRRTLSAYPLAVTGLASYSIYLVHEPVIAFLEHDAGYSAAAAGTIALAIGFVFWRLVEHPVAEGDFRDRLVSAVEPWVRKAFAWSGARAEHTLIAERGPEPVPATEAAAADHEGRPLQQVPVA